MKMKLNIIADDDISFNDLETMVGFILRDSEFQKDKLRCSRIYTSEVFKMYASATKYAKSVRIIVKRKR